MKNVKIKRLFIALNLPNSAKKEIAGFSSLLSKKCLGVRWVKQSAFHLTLHFLGNINTELEESIKLAMQSLAGKFHLLKFKPGRVNVFPNLKNPRILYLELIQTNGNSVRSLQKLLGKKLLHITRIDKRSWCPHITLGRVKNPAIFRLPEELPPTPGQEFTIDKYDLMQSRLLPEGSEYGIVEEFILSP